MVNVCVATLVLTRTDERIRGRVSAALGAVLQGAGVVSLVIGGALAAVLDPRQIFLLAGGLGASSRPSRRRVTGTGRPPRPSPTPSRCDISFAAELPRAYSQCSWATANKFGPRPGAGPGGAAAPRPAGSTGGRWPRRP